MLANQENQPMDQTLLILDQEPSRKLHMEQEQIKRINLIDLPSNLMTEEATIQGTVDQPREDRELREEPLAQLAQDMEPHRVSDQDRDLVQDQPQVPLEPPEDIPLHQEPHPLIPVNQDQATPQDNPPAATLGSLVPHTVKVEQLMDNQAQDSAEVEPEVDTDQQ